MNLNISTGTIFERVARACGIISVIIGGTGLAGWAFGSRVLTGVRLDYIPMAPNTAILVILLGSALFSGTAWPGNRTVRRVIAGISSLSILIAGLTLAGIITGIDLKTDYLFLTVTGTVGTVPVGRMSPVTATCLLLGSAALLLLLVKKNDLSAFLGTVMALVGGVVIIGYWYGAPLLYGGTVIPVALTTAVALGILGIGMNAAAGPASWPLSSITGDSTRARLLRGLLPVILILILIVNWMNTVVVGHADSTAVLFSAVTIILSLLVVYGVVLQISRKIGDPIDLSERERKRTVESVRRARDFYLMVLDDFPNPIWRSDIHAKCDYFNKDWLAFTGRRMEQELGDGWAEGVHPDDLERCVKIYLDHFHAQKPFEMEYRLRYHDGTYRWLYDNGKPLFTPEGEFAGYIGSCYDIHDRRMAEEEIRRLNADLEKRVSERTEDLQHALTRIEKSLHEKEILLREVHHRVKNNFQIILSLLSLQSRSTGDEKFSRGMQESQNRIRAMAFVHEKLYTSADLSRIDLEGYVKYLTKQLFTFFGVRPATVSLNLDINNIFSDINTAIPLGLIINELVSNSLKHAFPHGRTGQITIIILDDPKELILTYQDNGIGFSKGFDWQTAESLGFKLIRVLVDQLDGTIERESCEGTRFIIKVKKKTDEQGYLHGTFNPVPE